MSLQKHELRKLLMRNFKNNYRRNRFKSHSDRNHQKNGGDSKIINDLQNGSDFVRKSPGRNNHNASKLIEKYSSLAREALSNGDKILSENYFQHAEHFIRILGEREILSNKHSVIKSNFKSSEETSDENKKNINGSSAQLSKENKTTES